MELKLRNERRAIQFETPSLPSLELRLKLFGLAPRETGLHFLVLALMLVSPIICFVGGKVERDPKSACRAFINNDATPRNTSSIWFFTIFSSKISTSQPRKSGAFPSFQPAASATREENGRCFHPFGEELCSNRLRCKRSATKVQIAGLIAVKTGLLAPIIPKP